jgi:hypothetical protein
MPAVSNPSRIPSQAVDAGTDLTKPTQEVLQGLSLLPTKEELEKAGEPGALWGGPPQSVAVIEGGATALSKWWASSLGAGVALVWTSVTTWWKAEDDATQRVVLLSASIGTAAAILAIGYILGSDVRGRSAASVATIEARAKVADSMIRMAEATYKSPPPSPTAEVLPLPKPLQVRNTAKAGDAEKNWQAVALRTNGEDILEYLLVKADEHEWVKAEKTILVAPPGG